MSGSNSNDPARVAREDADLRHDVEPPLRSPPGSAIEAESVAGDRGIPSVNRARSLQARVSNALAIGLMSALGLGMISWYYTQVFARHSRASESARSSVKGKAQGEMVLPALGRIDPPRAPSVMERVLGPPPPLPSGSAGLDASFERDEESGSVSSLSSSRSATAVPAQPSPDRRLSGAAFIEAANSSVTAQASFAAAASDRSVLSAAHADSDRDHARSVGISEFDSWLVPTITPAVQASVLPTQQLLLAKGSFVDCTLETALDSSLPGMATCVTATDTFSADGTVVLLARGTQLVGETRGTVRQGSARIFVLWAQARTPDGVIVPLASPGTDELGRSGLSGEVDRHFFERFGAAMLISMIDGLVQGAVNASQESATVIYNPSSSQDLLTEVLRSTVNIPPTVRKRQGDRIQVLVARDLDFRSVYRLRAVMSGER